MELIGNFFEYKVSQEHAVIYYSEESNRLAKKVTKEKYEKIINDLAVDAALEFESESEDFYYSFAQLDGLNKQLVINIGNNKTIRREFVKWKLYEILKDRFIIDLFSFGGDLTLYRENPSSAWPAWRSFTTYNIIIRNWELHLSVKSKNTLVSVNEIPNFSFNEQPLYKAIVGNHVFHKEYLVEGSYHVVASREVRIHQKLIGSPQRPNYKNYFLEINKIYEEISRLEYTGISLIKGGLKKLELNRQYFQVARNYNVMVFKDGHTNVNAHNGMRTKGPYEVPTEILKNLEFIFIYPSSEKVKELFHYLRSGKTSYYQGLERYVQIPIPTPDKRTLLKYNYDDFERLPQLTAEFVTTLKQEVPNKYFFAIVLLPRSQKDVNGDDPEYFELKRILINNEIPSQFIDERAIGRDEFVYWLPNISIAILAKMGGIPWKLNREADKELILGFGDSTTGEGHFVGSTVFFDNSGKLKANGYFEATNLDDFILTLKNSIIQFIADSSKTPERLVIHYFKLPGSKEKDAVSKALRDIGLDIPFVIVTIFESRASDYIAFDSTYDFGMPMSGIVWKISKHEFVLFNNTRYEEWPRSGKPPKQEYPIKLNISFSNYHHYSDELVRRIIGQVFEFSRIYWKSVQQQSKPVTATYSGMIAEFGHHLGENAIPKNRLTQTTPWFI